MSPSRCADVGSPTRHRSGNCPVSRRCAMISTVPNFAGPFFITGNQKTDRAGIGRNSRHGSDHGRKSRPFISTAAAPQNSKSPRRSGAKRCAGPAIARRHDIEMPRKREMAAANRPGAHRDQVFRPDHRASFARNEPMHRKGPAAPVARPVPQTPRPVAGVTLSHAISRSARITGSFMRFSNASMRQGLGIRLCPPCDNPGMLVQPRRHSPGQTPAAPRP